MIRLCFVVAALILAGCGYNVYYTPLNNPVGPDGESIMTYQPGQIAPADVTLFLTQKPDGPYRELGFISIPSVSSSEQEEILQLFREKAAEVGADGVILLDTKTDIYSYANPIYIDDWGVYWQESIRTQTNFRGMAIQFLPDTAR